VRTATTIVRTLIRLTGLVQIVLGVLFWTGNARGLIPLHMLVGFVLVLSLWVMAALAARAGVQPGLVALAAVWGLVVGGRGGAPRTAPTACRSSGSPRTGCCPARRTG